MVGVAVNVTLLPAQIVVAVAEILTLAGKLGLTVMLTVFDVAGEPVTQVAFEVITTVTASVFDMAVVANVTAVCPETFEPLIFH